ncbi:MAG: DUF4870 domain-containing protein [Eubacteriales bacterium]
MENNNKLYNVLSYLNLWLIGLLVAPNEQDVKFHVNQGIILTIGWVAAGILSFILAFIPILGWVLAFAIYVFIGVLAIMGIINAAKGEQKELPVIGKIKILK